MYGKRKVVGESHNEVSSMLKQSATRTKKKQEKLQNLNQNATTLSTMHESNKIVANDKTFTGTAFTNKAQDNYPTSALTMGKWIAKDPRDSRMKNLSLLQGSALGTVQAPVEEALSWVEAKQNQIYNQNLFKLGTAMIDPMFPETQERAYSILPELKKVPEAHVTDVVAMQMTLNTILRDGTINGPDDLQFIMYILDPATILPLDPLWDLSGAFADVRENAKKAEDKLKVSGIFAPFRYGSTKEEDENPASVAQVPIKVAIAKRLFPAFRTQTITEVSKFLADISAKNVPLLPQEIGYANDKKNMTGTFKPYETMFK